MTIQNEKEVLEYLNIPSVPLKKWNRKDSFKDGVAVVNLMDGHQAYSVATFDADNDKEPRIKKVFCPEPFSTVADIFIVPAYMSKQEDVEHFDMDEDSKKAASALLEEAEEMENEGVETETIKAPEHEYFFQHITNDEQARAFISSYNQKHKVKGKLPKTHDALVARLAVIWSDEQKKAK